MIKIIKKITAIRLSVAIASLLMLLTTATIDTTAVAAEDKQAETAGAENIIKIQADKLVANITGDTAEFSGNVSILRGVTRISADYLTLHYNRKEGAKDLSRVDDSAVEKIEARGHVSIQHQGIRAQTETAVYETVKETLTLEGPETTVTKGPYSIHGVRMVLKGDANDLTVIGSPGNRVKTVIMADSDLF